MTQEHALIEYARRTGKSMDRIAKDAGTSRTTLYRIMSGEQNATVGLLRRISVATGGEVGLDQLVAFEPQPEAVAS